jgi:hypothetical protein
MFVPETKGVTLEELDEVFSVSTTHHAAYGMRQLGYAFRKYALRQNVRAETLYSWHDDEKPFVRGRRDPTDEAAASASHVSS